MTTADNNKLTRFGFSNERGGAHTARTMMLVELQNLIDDVGDIQATRETYIMDIEVDNCLGKRSGENRKQTARHLIALYALDPNITIFRSLLFFWTRDEAGQPLLALLCSYARDPVLQMSAPFFLGVEQGNVVKREALEDFIDRQEPGRFSEATLKSTAQNINSSWTQSGHLSGKVKKSRSKANPTPGSVAYALFLGYLNGIRGEALFTTEYVKLLDCSASAAMELAEEAARRGWIVYKRVGNVIEVLFPKLLTEQEMEWIREPD